jgi:hypothetical protein
MDRKYDGELCEEVRSIVNEVRKLASDTDLSVALECLARLVTVVLNDADVNCVH